MIPNLVPKEHLLSAISIRGTARHGSKVIGPFLGGIIMSIFTNGTGWVFILGAIFFLLAALQLLRINYRQQFQENNKIQQNFNFIQPMQAAANYAYRDKRLFLILALLGIHCAFTMAFDSLLPGIANSIGAGKETYSAITVAAGVGALITTLYVSTISKESLRGPILLITGIGSGIGVIIIGLATTPLIAIIGGFISGATQAPYMTVSATLIQQIVPDELRGRLMAFYIMIAAGFMAFMNLGFGLLADVIGERVLCFLPGIIWLFAFILIGIMSVRLRYLLQKGIFQKII
jgi:MFS family permease